MAVTPGTTFPMRPYGGTGTQAAHQMTLPLDVSETITAGDILIVNGTTYDLEDNNAPAGGTTFIFGIAMCSPGTDVTSGASVDRDVDTIAVVPAFPGSIFTGNIVTATDTDETGVYVDNIRQKFGTVGTDAEGYCCIAQGDTVNSIVYTLYYVRQADGSVGAESGVDVTNPRVAFLFHENVTVWNAGT